MTRHRQQQQWNAVRSQIRAQLARCEAAPDESAPARAAITPFRAHDTAAYYGPTREARGVINRILELDPASAQAAWDSALRQSGNRGRLVDALGDPSLDLEARSAVALLLLDGIERMVWQSGTATELTARIRWHLRRDPAVQSRMRYWWTHLDGSAPVMEALG